MGLQRGPGFLRGPPRGWIAARAWPAEFSILAPDADEHGSRNSLVETSHRMQVTWEVHVEGRELFHFSEVRDGPAWIHESSVSGKRWYKPRLLRGSYGLWRSVGVPGFIDPADATKLWVDWDAAFEEHEEAWARMDRIERELASRDGAFENVAHRLSNPLAGKLRLGDEENLEREIARRAGRAEAIRDDAVARNRAELEAQGITGEVQGEQARRIAQAERLKKSGRRSSALVVAVTDTGRTLGTMPVVELVLEVDDGGQQRQMVYEHIWGPRHLKAFSVGKKIGVRIDPDDPHVVELA